MKELAYFIGGIHGTGKSFFASQMATKLGMTHVSASEIIHHQKMVIKRVEDIDKNQDILTTGFESLSDGEYIMDGHYTLFDKRDIITRVPIDVFLCLSPRKLVLLTSDIERLYERLLHRDGVKYSQNMLQNMQAEEERYYTELCNTFHMDLEIIPNNF